jgi:PAS domain S-box-containing protein
MSRTAHSSDRSLIPGTPPLSQRHGANPPEKESIGNFSDAHAIILRDRDNRITYWSKTAEQFYGYSPEEAVGTDEFELLKTEFTQSLDSMVACVIRDGHWVGTLVQTTKHGGQLAVLAQWAPGHESNGSSAILETTTPICYSRLTQNALRYDQARLDTAMVLARLGTWEYDASSGFTRWDSRTQEIFGLKNSGLRSPAEVLRLIHPNDRARVAAELKQALDPMRGRLYESQYRIAREDGGTRWVMVRGQAVADEVSGTQRPFRYIGTVLDITEHKQAEEALRRNEDRFRLATFSDQITLYEQDTQLRYTWLYPYHPEHGQALGKSDEEILSNGEGARLSDLKREILKSGGSQRHEVRASLATGLRWYDLFISARRDQDGRIIGLAGAALDITERKKTEEALRQSEQRYRLMFDHNPDGVFSVDASGRFTIVNPACEVLSGYTQQELIGRHFLEICAPDEVAKTKDAFVRVLNQPGYSELETALVRKDGLRVELWLAGEPLLQDGVPIALLCTVKDITQRKQFRLELERQVDERTAALKQANDQLNSFVYALAHDFRAPLRSQSAFAKALLEDFSGVLDEKGRRMAQQIVHAAERQSALVEDLLDQVSLGREDLKLEQVDLGRIIAQAETDLRHDITAKNASLVINVPERAVLGNASCLHLILTNFISNALKFVPEGVRPQLKIWSEMRPSPTPAGSAVGPRAETIRLWVEDNGIGIRPDDLGRLFQAFRRLNSEARYAGTGIGLAIVKKATERMQGNFGVESEFGKGSRFWVELWAADSGSSNEGK